MHSPSILLVAALLVSTPAVISAQQAPQCRSQGDLSSMTEQIYDVFSDSGYASARAGHGIVTQSPTARRGPLTDNDMCVALRHATVALLASQGAPIARNADMSFFLLGNYYGVLVNEPRSPTDPVVSGTFPFYVFARSADDGARRTDADNHSRLRFVTVLRF